MSRCLFSLFTYVWVNQIFGHQAERDIPEKFLVTSKVVKMAPCGHREGGKKERNDGEKKGGKKEEGTIVNKGRGRKKRSTVN